MAHRTVLFMLLVAATGVHAQAPAQSPAKKQTDAELCAKMVSTNAEDARARRPEFRLPDWCYSPRVFNFSNKPSPQVMQEVLTLMRTLLDLSRVSGDAGTATVSIQASPDELAMADWLLREMDQPAGPREARRVDQYIVPASVQATPLGKPGKNDQVIKVFFLAHTENGRGVQQLLTVLRAVGDVQKVFNDTAQTALVVRCPESQMALTEYLIYTLDVAADSAIAVPEFHYKSPEGNDSIVRVFYLAHATAQLANQQILTALRNVVEIDKVFNYSSPAALVVRGSADEIAAAEWLIRSLDIPADAKSNPPAGPREFRFAGTGREDNVMQVFYQPHTTTPSELRQSLTLLQKKFDAMKTSAFDAPPALIIRGSAGQIAESAQLIP
jgi:type II secretory pathway component GspD/PulD (secretin)